MVYHGSMVNFGGWVHLTWVYVHPTIHETSWVYQCSKHLWSIWGVCLTWVYVHYVLYMKLIACNTFPLIYAQFGGSICHGYMCILVIYET